MFYDLVRQLDLLVVRAIDLIPDETVNVFTGSLDLLVDLLYVLVAHFSLPVGSMN